MSDELFVRTSTTATQAGIPAWAAAIPSLSADDDDVVEAFVEIDVAAFELLEVIEVIHQPIVVVHEDDARADQPSNGVLEPY